MTTIVNTFNVLMLRAPLQKYFDSIWAYHLIENLEYWFSRDKFQNTFYKFIEPCQKTKHFYREGDSWTEVLGISRKVFNKTFDLIGIRYSSETAFRAEADPFKGKLYASYHNRQTHQTFYVRNHNFVQDFLTRLSQENELKINARRQKKLEIVKAPSLYLSLCQDHNQQPIQEVTHPLAEDFVSSINSPSTLPVQDSGNGTYGHSPTAPKGRSIYIQVNTNNTSSLNDQHLIAADNLQEEDIKKMVDLWKSIVGHSYIPKLSRPLMKNLKETLVQLFDNCLDKWQAYCRKIASSKFLMGEKTSFKAWFTWAIKSETIQRILQNGFTFGDRQIKVLLPTEQQLQLQAKTLVNEKTCEVDRHFHGCLLKLTDIDTYGKWLQKLTCTRNTDGKIFILAPNRFTRDKVQTYYVHLIDKAMKINLPDENYTLIF